MNIIFWGTPELSVPILDCLCHSSHHVLAVVTQPDKCKGRGRGQCFCSPVKQYAVENNLPILQPESTKDARFIEQLHIFSTDVMILAAYGEILSKSILQLPPCGFVNIHFSLLPKYRGSSPISSAILAGDSETGVSIMQVVSKLDAGPIYGQKSVVILPTDTRGSLEQKLSQISGPFLLEILPTICDKTLFPQEQDHNHATYCNLIKKEDGQIVWQDSAEMIARKIRAMNPWPMMFSTLHTQAKGEIHIIFHKAEFLSTSSSQVECGEIVQILHDAIDIATGSGILRVTELQRAGKAPMQVKEFLRGTNIQLKDRFYVENI